jgi:hypothetical protein
LKSLAVKLLRDFCFGERDYLFYGPGVGESGMGVSGIGVGGISVGVSGGGFVGTSVTVGNGVLVGTSVAVGIGVSVMVGGGIDVRVGGIWVGILVWVNVGRTRLVRVGVTVTKRLGVEVEVSDDKGTGESVLVGANVCVGTNTVTACSVSAAAVSRLAYARSTMLMGATVIEMRLFKSPIAIAETLHNMLKPIAPAARTPKGPAYSLALTLVVLLWRSGGGCDICCRVISGVLNSVQTRALSHTFGLN